MSTRQIHVFISHAWAHSWHYDTLASWIFGENWSVGQASLDFRNFSIPKDDPIHNVTSTLQLTNAIHNQIARSHVIVIPTGMYAAYSKWIQKEIEGSKQYTKPILAVNPWGQQKSAEVVTSNADQSVGWNKQSVISGIWDLYYAQNK
ncbi:TIR domain-containing protein [Undibacterium sp. CY21W]|uniref:TIR domain-containing protein n=1 Tax=Undibacterium sp. CY21W TaxID=2762293 RepID=UPI00164AB02A|nr:TIR domain-containing protein [Undibacterium sp. CY21W]MBC3928180.1 TIR domain-containing protein [Undibacterium sp. CY21W]